MSIFMEEYFEEEDYLSNLPVIECADDPVTAMYRIAYEGEVNYKKIEEAVGIALEQSVNEAGAGDVIKSKFGVVAQTLKQCVEWVRNQFQKIIGAVAKFINEKYDKAFDNLCEKAYRHMKMNGTVTFKKPVSTYNYDINKAREVFDRCVNASGDMCTITTDDQDKVKQSISTCYEKCSGGKAKTSSELATALREITRGKKRIEIKQCTYSDFQKAASAFRDSKNQVKAEYNELKKSYNSMIADLKKQIRKVESGSKKNDRTEADKKLIKESNNLITFIREAMKIIQVAKGNSLETISGHQATVRAMAHACLGTKVSDPAQVGDANYKSSNSMKGSKYDGPKGFKGSDREPGGAKKTSYGNTNPFGTEKERQAAAKARRTAAAVGLARAKEKLGESTSIADIFGVALNEADEDDIFANVDFI